MNNEALIINDLEFIPCSRCCGSGQYSFCTMHGSRCFKCHGKGKVLTKRGSLTNEFIKSLRATEVSIKDLKIGDWIKIPGESKFSKIVSIGEIHPSSMSKDFEASKIAGHDVWIQHYSIGFNFEGRTLSLGLHVESKIPRHNGLDALATWKQGMEFQASLTKAGKPTKKTSPEGIAFIASLQK